MVSFSKLKSNLLLLKVKIKNKTPKSIIIGIKRICSLRFFRNTKSKAKLRKIQKTGVVTFDDILVGLDNLGVKSGMVVMVHSSLSGLGYVEGGPLTVINALIKAVGQDGLIIMPTPPITGSSVESLIRGEIFNINDTPCVTGKICETFRTITGVHRSCHPTHSVTAFGRNAKWLTKDHHKDSTPFGPNSPFARLLEIGGSILGLGLDVRWITFYHHFEDINDNFPIHVYSKESYNIPVIMTEGKQIYVSTPNHDPIVSSFRLNNDQKTLKEIDFALTKYGKISRGKVGKGDSFLIKAQDIISTLEYLQKKEGKTIYNMKLIKRIKPESLIIHT